MSLLACPRGLLPLCRHAGVLRRRPWPAKFRCPLVRVRAETNPDQKPSQEPEQPEPKLPEWVVTQIQNYDEAIAKARIAAEDQQKEVEKFNEQIEELQLAGAPGWILTMLAWIRDTLDSLLRSLRERAARMEEERGPFVAELTNLAIADDAPQGFLEDLSEEQRRTLEKPETLAASIMFQSLLLATLMSLVGSLGGADSGRLLVWPADWQAGASTWAMWTAPYVGATLLACSLLPSFTTRRVLRGTFTNHRFFSELGLGSLAALALVVGGAQVVVYQGIWVDAALDFWHGGPQGGSLDPSLVEDNLRGSLGSLVTRPGLAFLAAPLAVLSVAFLEAGWWASYTRADTLFPFLKEYGMDDGGEEPMDGWAMVHKQYMDTSPVQDNEVGLIAARVFAASAYLSAEALVSGSLWFAVGTSAAGILTSMLAARQQGRAGTG